MNNLFYSGSQNSLVGERDDDGSLNLPKGMCVCGWCGAVREDATDDGDELCADCLQAKAERELEEIENNN